MLLWRLNSSPLLRVQSGESLWKSLFFFSAVLVFALASKPALAETLPQSAPERSDETKSSFIERSSTKAQNLYRIALHSFEESKQKVVALADDTYRSLEIRVVGLKSLRSEEFFQLLPNDRSFYWWVSNQSALAAQLRQHPLIEQISFQSCASPSAVRCFMLKVQERMPTLWVKAEWGENKESRFLIADDGAVLAVLRTEEQMRAASKFDESLLARFSAHTLTSLPVLDARDLANISDASEQLFKRAVHLVSVIQRESGSEVYQLRFMGNREVEVEFAAQPFKVVFNVEESAALDARIAAQVQRLNKVLQSKPLLASRATSINLGLEREAFAVLANSGKPGNS